MSENNHLSLELGLETIEILWDAISSNELVDSFPVVSQAVKICKSIDSIKERIFSKKLIAFFSHLDEDGDISDGYKSKYDELLGKEELGESILLTLDAVTNIEKANIVAVHFNALVNGDIVKSEFMFFLYATEKSYIGDLRDLFKTKENIVRSNDLWVIRLASTGLAKMNKIVTMIDVSESNYSLTELGKKYKESYIAMRH
jgi:hypothetical protein